MSYPRSRNSAVLVLPGTILLALLTPRIVRPQPSAPAPSASSAAPNASASAVPSASASAPSTSSAGSASSQTVPPLPPPTPSGSVLVAPPATVVAPPLVSPVPTSQPRVQEPPVSQPPIRVTVQGDRPARYQAKEVDLGPLGRRRLLDTPFSVHVVRNDLIVDHDLRTPEDMIRLLPSAQIEARGSMEIGRPQTRGFESDVFDNTRLDGFSVLAPTVQPVEMYDRLEVLHGPAAALYGLGSPAGQFNAILKRPTDKPLRRLQLGYLSDSAFFFHSDFGGRAGPNNALGYRANLSVTDGERYVDNASMKRELASLMLDARVTKTTRLEGLVSGFLLDQRGYPGGFTYGTKGNSVLPAAPDPTRVGLGQSYAGTLGKSGFFELQARQEFAPGWQLVAGVSHQITGREFRSLSNALTNNTGSYSAAVRESADAQRLTGNQIYLQGQAQTGEVLHEMQVGANGKYLLGYASEKAGQYNLGNATFAEPGLWPEPTWGGTGPTYQSNKTFSQSLLAAYTITYQKRLSATAIGSMTWIHIDNYANPAASGSATAPGAGAGTDSEYEAKAVLAPTLALGYKLTRNTLAYANYGMGVQQGPTAPSTAANAYETLAPYRSHQAEVGCKAEFRNLTLTAAAFRIERPFAFIDPLDKVFRKQGQQVNYGGELGLAGRIARDLVVYGGVTFLDPRLKDTAKPTTSNKLVVGVPRWQGNLVVDYELPFLPDLVASFILHYTGERAANDTNRSWAAEYATVDTAARYGFKVKGKRFVTRVAVRNLLNQYYWVSLFPGSINGESGSYTAFLGAPRTFEATLRLDL